MDRSGQHIRQRRRLPTFVSVITMVFSIRILIIANVFTMVNGCLTLFQSNAVLGAAGPSAVWWLHISDICRPLYSPTPGKIWSRRRLRRL